MHQSVIVRLVAILSALIAAVVVAAPHAAANPWPVGNECSQGGCIYDWAFAELNNASHRRESGPNNCNFYSGYWGSSGTNNCGVINGTRWRSNEWCADFARYVWLKGGADVTGLDPWAGSFYRANKNNGSYHPRNSRYVPAMGDAVLFDWDGQPTLGNDGWDIDHVGIVEAYSNGSLTTIEGNTSGGGGREGIFRKHRPLTNVVGYVSPRF